jgi:hypothetical protein
MFRERMFTEGSAALRRALAPIGGGSLPAEGDYYACPCCLHALGRDALEAGFLTDEHVPPQALGGRILALTCARCNNLAGSALDIHAVRAQTQIDVLSGLPHKKGVRAEFTIGPAVVRGTLFGAGNSFLLSGVPKANDPRQLDLAEETINGWISNQSPDAGFAFRFSDAFLIERAQLSWARAAYLAAFAALGYRYIFRPQFDPLRAALAAPEASTLPPISFIDPNADRGSRQILYISEPTELDAVAVRMGAHTVYLPGPDDGQTMDSLSAALSATFGPETQPLEVVAKQIPWPTRPTYALDR